MPLKVRPEIQLDGRVAGHKIDGTDSERSYIRIPAMAFPEQVIACSGDLRITLGGKVQPTLVLSIGQGVIPHGNFDAGGRKILLPKLEPNFLAEFQQHSIDLLVVEQIGGAGDAMPNALNWRSKIAGHDP